VSTRHAPPCALASRYKDDTVRDFRAVAAGRAPAQTLLRYALAEQPAPTHERIAAIIRGASRNALRIPEFSAEEREWLAHAFAPRFEIESGGAFDRFGRLTWRDGNALVVDGAAPVVYYRVACTRHEHQTLTQPVYTWWFAQRPREHALDLLAGNLDGVVFRVTLSTEGEPLVYDSRPSAGAMRQWGHHATALVGRRHFDDADLIERRLSILRRVVP
jgi:hypothetical protein